MIPAVPVAAPEISVRLTATILVTQFTCPFLRHVLYGVKQPLPFMGTRRRFGNLVHAAIAEYERHGRSLDHALRVVDEQAAGLTAEDLDEARSILTWRHERRRDDGRKAFLIEGPLRTAIGEHRLDVRMDRLDVGDGGRVLVEYKGGKRVDLDLVRVQLAVLAYAVERVLGEAPVSWEVEVLRARKVVEVPAETDAVALREFTGGLAESVARGDKEPQPYDPAFCRRCPARSYCPRATPNPKPLAARSDAREVQLALF